MHLEKTPIWAAVRKIFSETQKPVRFAYTAKIHTTTEDFDVMKIVSIDIIRDYVNNIGDVVMIEFLMPLGDYVKRFYPNRTNMELTIFRKQLEETGEVFKKNTSKEAERFKVVFLPNENPQVKGSDFETFDQETLDLMDVVHVKLQLLNRSLEPLRIKTTGSIFKNKTNEDVIRGLLMGESLNVLIDGKPAIDGIDMVKADNQEVQRHVIIPQNTLLTSVPSYCQEKMNGVYSTGIGTYLQSHQGKRYWFVYPLYNTQRFNENVKKAIFYVVSSKRFPGVERTYRESGDTVFITITSDKSYSDNAETDQMEQGSGFRMADARSFLRKPIAVAEEGPIGVRNKLNFEVAFKERADNLNFAPAAGKKISSNPFPEFSKISQRNGGRIDFTWNNSNPSLIYPGMPCKYIYMEGKTMVQKEGVILFCHTVVQLQGQGVLSNAHLTSSKLTLFVNQSNV